VRRAEQVAPHRGRGQPGQEIAPGRDQNDYGRAAVPAAQQQPEADRDDAGHGRHDPADGRGDRIGHDQLVIGYNVRQGRRQRRQEETVHAQRGQRADIQRHTQFADADQQGGDRDQHRADEG